MTSERFQVAVVGGGFYGCCIALLMRSLYDRVVVLERGDALFERASAVNQARVHAGFHYPRSMVTAMRSLRNMPRFTALFAPAIRDDFTMLYAIARQGSKIGPNRFAQMFERMGAPIARADAAHRALFDGRLVDAVFACREPAFDWRSLRDLVGERLGEAGVEVRRATEVVSVQARGDHIALRLADRAELIADTVFNATYSELNPMLRRSGLGPLPLKHEWTEVALIDPPRALAGLAVTLMDGPFFSTMPFPAEGAYSLTHVRYTPRWTWTDGDAAPTSRPIEELPRESRWRHMVADARRYLPCMDGAAWRRSLFEVKTVLTDNEGDDGRPILFRRHSPTSRLFSVLGGKIDNIFDLFDAIRQAEPAWAGADLRHLAA